MKKWLSIIFVAMLVLSMAACSQKDDKSNNKESEPAAPKVIKIGAIPDQSAADINRSMGDVAKYLADKTGMKVEYVPSVDYAALVTAFQRGEIQLAWFGGLTGVQARNQVSGAEAIAQRPRDAEFHSVFITQKNSGIKKLGDLKGKNFTFGSESSTSGHLMPRYYMIEAGIDANKDLDGKPNFSGSHDTTYKLVESGAFKAGALNEAVWEAAVKEGKVDTNKVEVFYKTPAFYDYNWTVNKMDKATKKKLTDAILSMGSGQKKILDLFQTDKFVETKNENYKPIEKVAKELNIIK
ncbi:putative selenate ABC transporter substrate-binding protein [Neobacillus sp. PS3-34]|uniref:putative selenate ABC transporter substrate-binding protein n=1 Tax=Neobacillus sp. PS3-34 TaxID=3070678 RepID=UPI0027DF14AE|nr:putative selenate ABC transporter substrate-binding protein [Neobacillus sp. PS3-34]WML48166.1 putative selenate ABC transporter substrate-binding protein [Neobacillus sp. PS3-34]